MLGTHARTADAQAPAVFYKISTATGFRIPYRIKLYDSQLGPNPRRMRVFLATWRNQAICRYFEGIYPEPPLMGLSVSHPSGG